LAGRPDRFYSINDGQGGWCEVQVWRGERFVRHELMSDGSPAPFVSIEGTATGSGRRGSGTTPQSIASEVDGKVS
jgi:hypothetical protein